MKFTLLLTGALVWACMEHVDINTWTLKGAKRLCCHVYFCHASGFLGRESELPPVRQLIRAVPQGAGHEDEIDVEAIITLDFNEKSAHRTCPEAS